MINIEQVKLLEAKVGKAVDYIERLTKENAAVERLNKENAALRQQEADLQAKLGTYQKRIEELELLFKEFKDNQAQIEEAILSTLDKLSQFEKAMEKSLRENKPDTKPVVKEAPKAKPAQAVPAAPPAPAAKASPASGGDIPDPLDAVSDDGESDDGELDIF